MARWTRASLLSLCRSGPHRPFLVAQQMQMLQWECQAAQLRCVTGLGAVSLDLGPEGGRILVGHWPVAVDRLLFPPQSKTTVSPGTTSCTLRMERAAPTCWWSTPPPGASAARWTCSWPRPSCSRYPVLALAVLLKWLPGFQGPPV